MSAAINIRQIACEALSEVTQSQQSLSTVIPKYSEFIPEKDQSLFQELLFGCCRWYFYLDKQCQSYLKKPLHRNEFNARNLLIIGAYQLQFMRIPAHAAINETVAASDADSLQSSNFKNLINAVLRNISRSQEEQAELPTTANTESFPLWMREKLQHNWPEFIESILRESNARPPMTLRVNIQKNAREEYFKRLEEAGIEASPSEFSSRGLTLSQPQDVKNLPGFADGCVSVQDEAAQLCTDLLDLKTGHRVLDACAAPGGKTCAILEQHPNLDVHALDHDKKRLQRVSENLSRLGLNATIHHAPAEQTEQWWDQTPFDRILLDAPCSATGVIRRHPDIKLLRKQEDLKNLADLQLELLKRLWPCLKEGGILLYATCSIFPQENSRVIERFLKQQPDVRLNTIDAAWGIDTGYGRQLFPQNFGHDGFFYAQLTKTA
jgi:16S rRNA (cytosine967-C5)-methyltransferase